jgi:hypothetical protein
MDLSQSLFNLPIWGMLLLTFSVLFAAFEGGFHLGKHFLRRVSKEKDSLAGPMVSAILGLLAFMLAFSFGMAMEHFHERRVLVLEEANSIREAYDMVDLLGEKARVESKKLLREYVDIRSVHIESQEKLKEVIVKSNEIQDRLWVIAMDNEFRKMGASSSWLYSQYLSDMFITQSKRVMFGTQRMIPPIIWIVLFGLAIGGIGAMGYHAGLVGIRGFLVYQILILTFSMVMMLVYDLDRSQQGLFKVTQRSMQILQHRIHE